MPTAKNALPDIDADLAGTSDTFPASGIAARTAVRSISEATRSPLTGGQSFEIFAISSPHALAAPLRQFHFL
jgi:hypothetical protein